MQRIISILLPGKRTATANNVEDDLNYASMALRVRVEQMIRKIDEKQAA
jgi:hypothetical protein